MVSWGSWLRLQGTSLPHPQVHVQRQHFSQPIGWSHCQGLCIILMLFYGKCALCAMQIGQNNTSARIMCITCLLTPLFCIICVFLACWQNASTFWCFFLSPPFLSHSRWVSNIEASFCSHWLEQLLRGEATCTLWGDTAKLSALVPLATLRHMFSTL